METGKILVGTSNETSFYLSKYISKKFHMISTQDSASAIASNESQKFGNRCFFSWDTLLFYSFPSETLKKSLQKSKYTSMKGCDHVVYQSSGQLFLWRGSIFFFLFLMWKINQYELKLEFFNYRNRWSESVPIIHTYRLLTVWVRKRHKKWCLCCNRNPKKYFSFSWRFHMQWTGG